MSANLPRRNAEILHQRRQPIATRAVFGQIIQPKQNEINQAKEKGVRGNFLDISKNAPNGVPIEQMLFSYYDSKGTFKYDRESFPALVKETNEYLKKIVPNYQLVSQGEKTVNNGWRAYEAMFQGETKTTGGEKF